MIVFDLKCSSQAHVFEAWFGSSGDYEAQQARGLIACPVCGDTSVMKAVMAPAIAAKGNQRTAPTKQDVAAPAASGADMAKMQALVEAVAQAQQKLLADSTWVGRDFADQARAMHYGEQDRASIHGEVAPATSRRSAAREELTAAFPRNRAGTGHP